MPFDSSISKYDARTQSFGQIISGINADMTLINANTAEMQRLTNRSLEIVHDFESGAAPSYDEITNPDGSIDMAKRNAVAASYWDALDYRYGKKSADIPELPTYAMRTPDYDFPGGNGVGGRRTYQLGSYKESDPEWVLPGGDFSSNIEHILWVPDQPTAHLGVSQIQATSFSNDTGSLHPELIWNLYGDGLDGLETLWWKNHGYPNLGKFSCMGHALGRPGWATQSIVGTVEGYICTIGANTMTNRAITRLRVGCVPTFIAVTSSNEFALVSYWDTVNNNAGIAYVALCGLGHDMTLDNPRPNPAGTESGWWGEWEEPRFGLHNLGNMAAMKVVGYQVLPGMLAPTAVSATTGHYRYHYLNGSEVNGTTGNTGNWVLSEAQRQRWMNGDYANRYAKQGFAVVVSKSEKKAICIDLRKLFAYYNSMYFNADRNVFLQTANVGMGAGQWPYTFDEATAQIPDIVKTIDLEDKPTAVYVFNYRADDKPRHCQFHIGLENGQMVTYSCGGYAQPAPGNYNATTLGNSANIVEQGRRFVGRNPTSIQPVKEKGGTSAGLIRDVTRGLLIWSREEKALRWVDLGDAAYASTELRKCQMSQITDGTWAEDTDNHGTESYVAMVADPTGRCTHHVVWGPTYFHTYKGEIFPLLNNQPFNYGNKFAVAGKPYMVMAANIS